MTDFRGSQWYTGKTADVTPRRSFPFIWKYALSATTCSTCHVISSPHVVINDYIIIGAKRTLYKVEQNRGNGPISSLVTKMAKSGKVRQTFQPPLSGR
jgi:hypothetical protein